MQDDVHRRARALSERGPEREHRRRPVDHEAGFRLGHERLEVAEEQARVDGLAVVAVGQPGHVRLHGRHVHARAQTEQSVRRDRQRAGHGRTGGDVDAEVGRGDPELQMTEDQHDRPGELRLEGLDCRVLRQSADRDAAEDDAVRDRRGGRGRAARDARVGRRRVGEDRGGKNARERAGAEEQQKDSGAFHHLRPRPEDPRIVADDTVEPHFQQPTYKRGLVHRPDVDGHAERVAGVDRGRADDAGVERRRARPGGLEQARQAPRQQRAQDGQPGEQQRPQQGPLGDAVPVLRVGERARQLGGRRSNPRSTGSETS